MTTKIYGRSDDLIEFDGDYYRNPARMLLELY